MAGADEADIKRQFLEEAQDYLDEIENVVLSLADNPGVDRLDAALRSAHSIKGGAAMMGFDILSQLAHRYEDYFKVLRYRHPHLDLDPDLEQLLLHGVDLLRQVADRDRQGHAIPSDWIATHAEATLTQIHDRLGDPPVADPFYTNDLGDQQAMAVSLFETELDQSLNQLANALEQQDWDQACAETLDLAEILHELGGMLDLPAFSTLSAQVQTQLDQDSDPPIATMQAALATWRNVQAIVLTGQFDLLPQQLLTPPTASPTASLESADDLERLTDPDRTAEYLADTSLDNLPDILPDISPEISLGPDDLDSLDSPERELAQIFPEPAISLPPPQNLAQSTAQSTASNAALNAALNAAQNTAESSVRVAVRQLDKLNDLLGELTIGRSGLDLHLTRLHQLVEHLSDRVKILTQANLELRTAYDQAVTNPAQATSRSGSDQFHANLSTHPPVSTHPPTGIALPETLTQLPDLRQTNPMSWSPTANLADSFDSLELDQYGPIHPLTKTVMESVTQVQELVSDITLSLSEATQTHRDLNRTARQVQTAFTQVRMRPLSDVVGRFPRALRELSRRYEKEVNLQVVGADTLIDRTVLEVLSDPLLHLLRNCFDHGIEDLETRRRQGKPDAGQITIHAAYRGNQTVITLKDDGQGIDIQKLHDRALRLGWSREDLAQYSDRDLLNLIFEPGFSTAERVTDLSGRGVGMDVVRTNLQQVRGDITIDTQPSQGTTFILRVPFSLSVMRVLMVESQGLRMAFPREGIAEVLLLELQTLIQQQDHTEFLWEGQAIPLVSLEKIFQFHTSRLPQRDPTPATIDAPIILLINQGAQKLGLQVDRCWGEQEATIRQVEGGLPLPRGMAGCTLLGNGQVLPLVDVLVLGDLLAAAPPTAIAKPLAQSHSPVHLPAPPTTQTRILIVDDSANVRRYLALTLERAGYQVEQASDGQEALDRLSGLSPVQGIICDIEMPRLDGFSLVARLKADPLLYKVPIVLLTSRASEKHRQLGLNLGAAAYFIKPYQEAELLSTLAELIHGGG